MGSGEPVKSPIEKLNPLTKMLAIFCLGLATLIYPNSWLGLGIVIVLFGVAGIAHILTSFAKTIFGFGIPISLMLFFIQGLYSPKNKTIIADLGFTKLGEEGLLYAAKIVITLLVFLATFYIMNQTTYAGKMVAALTRSGINPQVGYLILASLNVVPQMHRRLDIIKEAQEARGVETTGGLWARLKAYVPLMGPVVMSSLTDAQERGMTLETRGFANTNVKRTSYIEVTTSKADTYLRAGLIIFLVAVIIISIWMRWAQ